MWRVAVYAHEAPGRRAQALLDRQVAHLATGVARRPGWWHVATYAEESFTVGWRPGLARLLADAPGRLDIIAVDAHRRLSVDRGERDAILAQLAMAGVTTVALGPSATRRLVALAAEVALVDLIDDVLR